MSRRLTAGLSGALLLVTGVVLYAGLRLVQARLWPEPDPALVIWSTRIALFWRLAVVGYALLLGAPLAWRWARRDPVGVTRALGWLLPGSVVLLAWQALWVP